MLSRPALGKTKKNYANFAEQEHGTVRKVHKGCVPLSAMKTLETQLQKRGITKTNPVNLASPLWFIAETERNVFLWRNGFSLADADNFEFWVDVEALVNKRLRAQQQADADNPFHNGFWSTESIDGENLREERAYFEQIVDAVVKIEAHLLALSLAALGDQNEKPVVVIPKI